MFIPRYISSDLAKSLNPGRATLLMGARRVGKTTLIKGLQKGFVGESQFYNCDDPKVREIFTDISLEQLKLTLRDKKLIIFDETQRIKNIGITLKLIIDEMPNKLLLVSGSSSLDLANEISESLTGRKKTFYLQPISFLELWNYYRKDRVKVQSFIDNIMRFGSYPVLFGLSEESDKVEYLLEIVQDYLFKDALEYQQVRNPEQLRRLLSALALQIGQEVSYTELANIVGIDQKTIIRYIDLLEKSYVIFRLPAFSRNMRKEIGKSRKIYFCDIGVRNALIRNFNSYDIRSDRGHVWENLLVAERIKRDLYRRRFKNYYFWRTYDQKEIDLVEEFEGCLSGFEFKWSEEKFSKPGEFLISYPGSSIDLINKDSMLEFVI
jgi:uncharacterized protein